MLTIFRLNGIINTIEITDLKEYSIETETEKFSVFPYWHDSLQRAVRLYPVLCAAAASECGALRPRCDYKDPQSIPLGLCDLLSAAADDPYL